MKILKKLGNSIDKLVLGGLLATLTHKYINIRADKLLRKNLSCRHIVLYENNCENLLAGLCDKYGSDKGEIKKSGHPYPWPSHTYTDFYSRNFDHCRNGIMKVFECGIGTNNPNLPSSMGIEGKPGASLRVWRDYFPNANIYGADIDKNTLFKEERINTFFVDQTSSSSIVKLWREIGESDFDFIVDDGLHTFEAGVCLFEHSFSRLAQYGIYVIEDVKLSDLLKFERYFSKTTLNFEIVNLYRPGLSDVDNSLVVIRK